jgi:hypothetical protein
MRAFTGSITDFVHGRKLLRGAKLVNCIFCLGFLVGRTSGDSTLLLYFRCTACVPPIKAPDQRSVRAAFWALLSLLVLGYITEFAQEHSRIQLLKSQTPLSASCAELVSAVSYTWTFRILYHATGLESHAQQDCAEQRRIDGLLPIPNPLVVFVNLFWHSFVGESSLSVLLSRQSYLFQITFIFAAVAALAVALWTLAARLPGWILSCMQAADNKKKARYEGIQRELKQARNN